MCSKSANYCYPNREKTTGLMLLGEVALGNMYELTEAQYMDQAPPVPDLALLSSPCRCGA
jgi:poly [ADP-ribose] polymerase